MTILNHQVMGFKGCEVEMPNEIFMMSELQGIPGILKLHDYRVDTGSGIDRNYYLIMDKPVGFIELYSYLIEFSPLPESVGRVIARGIIRIVQDMDRVGIHHMDLKDENILVNPDNFEVYLIDFGAAKYNDVGPVVKYEGTLLYLCPEFLNREPVTSEGLTVWQLGIVIFVLLHLSVPFRNEREIVTQDIKLKMDRSLSYQCRNLIAMSLRKSPSQRLTLQAVGDHRWISNSGPV